MQVRWTPQAASDLAEITRYIRKDNPPAARSVTKTLFDAANALNKMPSRGRIGRISSTRELVVAGLPYLVVYEVGENAVQILHIMHAARDR